jgi:phenylacetate-coenzyme A ligase PaaK-like adenylate-forming protein
MGGILPEWKLLIESNNGIDEATLQIAVSERMAFFDEVRKLEQLRGDIIRLVRRELNITVKVKFVESALCSQNSNYSECRVIDLRKVG